MRKFSIIFFDTTASSFHCRSYDRFQYEKGFQGRIHTHSYSEILFVTEGKGFFHLTDKKIPIKKGSVIINNRNIAHTESAHPDSPMAYVILAIDDHSFLQNQTNNPTTIHLDFSKEYSTLSELVCMIELEYSERKPLWQYALQGHINSYMLYVLRKANLVTLPIQVTTSPNPLANVYLYLTTNYDEDISLDKLADKFCINKYHLAHSFKRIYGESIIQTLNRIRCQTARQLLTDFDYPINLVANNVGFNSSSYFSKVYQEFYNETPTTTRKASFYSNPKQSLS